MDRPELSAAAEAKDAGELPKRQLVARSLRSPPPPKKKLRHEGLR